MYYNTTNETGQMLINFQNEASKQEFRVLDLFKKKKYLSPSQAWKHFESEGIPLTSIRRAITNLTNDGFVVKTEQKVKGLFGRNETIYLSLL